jgi:hypothetical protein
MEGHGFGRAEGPAYKLGMILNSPLLGLRHKSGTANAIE